MGWRYEHVVSRRLKSPRKPLTGPHSLEWEADRRATMPRWSPNICQQDKLSCAFGAGRRGRQPKTSCRSTGANPLPLVAEILVNKTSYRAPLERGGGAASHRRAAARRALTRSRWSLKFSSTRQAIVRLGSGRSEASSRIAARTRWRSTGRTRNHIPRQPA